MKKCLFLIAFFAASAILAQTGHVENFNDNNTAGWGASPDYDLSVSGGRMQIEANKRDTWNSFTYSIPVTDLSANPYVSLKIRTDRDVNVGFFIQDTQDEYAYPTQNYQEIVTSDHFAEYTFDFSDISGVDLTKIKLLNFVFNPGGAKTYRGTVWFDDLKIGDQAAVAPSLTQIPDFAHIINTPEVTVPFRGVSDPGDAAVPTTITATSSNPALIPNPVVTYTNGETNGSMTYTPAPDLVGSSTITVTVSGSAPSDKIVTFDVDVIANQPPVIDQAEPVNVMAGVPVDIFLTGIGDGNANAEQNLQVWATSGNPTVIPDPAIQYINGEPNATLTLAPVAGQTGDVDITVFLQDDGGILAGGTDAANMTFNVTVLENLNHSPTLDPIEDVSVMEGSGQFTVLLTGISDGDGDSTQTLTWTASSSNIGIVENPAINFTSHAPTAELILNTGSSTGSATITVRATDNGGNAENNGDLFVERTFRVTVRVKPTNGFEDEFEDGITAGEWPKVWGNPGEDSHQCTEENGYLKIEIDKTRSGNKWAGLWYNIPQELDLSENPYISLTMKTDQPGTEMLIFLWDAYDHYNTAATVRHTVTGEFVEYYFDFTGLNLQGNGEIVDFSRIKSLLINFDPGGDSPLFNGTFYWEDMRVGALAHRETETTQVVMDAVPDFVIPKNTREYQIQLTGIHAGGEKVNPVSITRVLSSKKDVVPVPEFTEVKNGEATLTVIPVKDQTGKTSITVYLEAEGSNRLISRFDLHVLDKSASSAVLVNVDLNTEFQTMDGFGAFMGGDGGDIKNDRVIALAADIGMSLARFGVINDNLEPFNDNSDPDIINMDGFGLNGIALENMRRLRDETEVEHMVLTWWSPPSWMKRNKNQSAEYWATDNKLEPHYYDEYAEHMAAAVKMVKYETGIDLYAISPQNEPEFNEPYPSCVVTANELRDIIKVVGPRLESEGLDTKIFWGEVLPAQNHVRQYLDAVKKDATASRYADIFAIHNYDADGVNVGGAGARTWENIADWAHAEAPKYPTWMSETSGHPNNWDGALELAGNIFNALGYGNASAWIWWSFNASGGSEQFGLVVDNEPTSRFFVSKQYYKFIRPDAVRSAVESMDEDVPCLVFKHADHKTVTVVALNKSDDAKVIQIGGGDLPLGFESWTTSENRNCEYGPIVKPDGLALLPPKSLSTFVGNYDIDLAVEDETAKPEMFRLYQNYPNPFNPTTTIEFLLPRETLLSIRIFDVLGREVRTLADQHFSAGSHVINWNGRDNGGSAVATGVYFYRLKSENFTAVRKCLLVR